MNWDQYFYNICKTVSLKSPCLSRQIGAILVRNNSIVSTGYNGPARGIPHCGSERYLRDSITTKLLDAFPYSEVQITCPRRLLKIPSGERMELCYAQHAEENCISNAARLGVSTLGTTLYLNSLIPCKNCFSTLINAGIKQIVCESPRFYDSYTKFISENSNIRIREFIL